MALARIAGVGLVVLAMAGCPGESSARGGSGGTLLRRAPSSEESLDRKARSEARLQSEGVPFHHTLPALREADDIALREPDDVARRVLALVLVTARALGPERFYEEIRATYAPLAALSPAEEQFLADTGPTEGEVLAFKWRVEALYALAWAMHGPETLGRPEQMADTRAIVEMIGDTPEKFVRYARLRPVAELLDEADLAYRYHWATRDAFFHDRPMPAGLLQGVVKERHHALNWLIGVDASAAWDEVPTDT